MDTVVTVEIAERANERPAERAIDRAFAWFHDVERCCSRFDPSSEISALGRRVGEDVSVSTMLFEAMRFALALADETDGAFDPTIGRRMEALGFDREYRTGARVATPGASAAGASFRDVHLDEKRRTIRIDRPVVLDLGAVAKGLAIDLAARELATMEDFAIDAGGDLYLAGCNAAGSPWAVGIRDPRAADRLTRVVRVSDRAVCTSGDYERIQTTHHIVDPRTGEPASRVASVTAIGRSAMLADGLATAAFVLGPRDGLALLERHGLTGLIISATLDSHETAGGLA
jgi:thiamine biosynthesis lipoprotein